MSKGFFTQGLVVLLERPVGAEALRAALAPGREVIRTLARAEAEWLGGEGVVVAFRPEVNGYVAVDVVEARWPDDMGDAKDGRPLFGAWALGHFGPLTYPGNLARAAQQAWRWKEGAPAAVAAHRAFARVRLSYVFGAGSDALVMPRDCDPVKELEFVTGVARALLDLPGALALFVPGGEVLLSAALLDESLRHHAAHGLPPVAAWCNVRLFRLDGGWLLMDTVGNGQLDLPDLEAAFREGTADPGDVDAFLRNATDYLRERGEGVVKDGDTVDGPDGQRWHGHRFEDSVSDPPRRVLRWLPLGAREVPPRLLGRDGEAEPEGGAGGEGDAPRGGRPWWRFWGRA